MFFFSNFILDVKVTNLELKNISIKPVGVAAVLNLF
jgi:hypothetical protein